MAAKYHAPIRYATGLLNSYTNTQDSALYSLVSNLLTFASHHPLQPSYTHP
jgi:hypothetical protein